MTIATSPETEQRTRTSRLEREALLPAQRAWIMGRTQLPTGYQPPSTDEPKVELTKSTQAWFLLKRILNLRSTPESDRWTDAQWPTENAFVDAAEFVRRLPERLKATPHISLADDGEVNLRMASRQHPNRPRVLRHQHILLLRSRQHRK